MPQWRRDQEGHQSYCTFSHRMSYGWEVLRHDERLFIWFSSKTWRKRIPPLCPFFNPTPLLEVFGMGISLKFCYDDDVCLKLADDIFVWKCSRSNGSFETCRSSHDSPTDWGRSQKPFEPSDEKVSIVGLFDQSDTGLSPWRSSNSVNTVTFTVCECNPRMLLHEKHQEGPKWKEAESNSSEVAHLQNEISSAWAFTSELKRALERS
jgi:hypothetical protein